MTKSPNPRSSGVRAAAVALAVAAVGFGGYHAVAETSTARHAAAAFQHAHWGDRDRGGRSEAEIEAKIDRMVAHAAIEIDATDSQRDQIAAVAKAAAKEIRPLRDAMREDAEKMRALLLADVVNPSEVEAIRAARLADFDAKSKVLTQAVTDIAAILTPAQRQTLEARIEEFQGHSRKWRR